MKTAKVGRRFSVSFDKDYRKMKRPKFEDVVREVWEQLDDLGHDLTNALLVAPKGCTPRQFSLALNEINRQNSKGFTPPNSAKETT